LERRKRRRKMKAMVIRAVVALAVVTSFTVTAEAKPVDIQQVSNVTSSISVTSTVSAVGVLAKR
jgi:hypothetical protein